jgi:hypothetical protein
MKGIFLTQETKQEIEAKIEELKTTLDPTSLKNAYKNISKISVYKELLQNSIILSVEESWDEIYSNNRKYGEIKYLNGVIIQPKQ